MTGRVDLARAVAALATGLLLASCGAPPPPLLAAPSLLDRHAFDRGRRLALPDALREVSGLTTTPDGRVFAHDDERAVLYEVDVSGGSVVRRETPFGTPPPRGDFEGLAWVGDRFVLLRSDGLLLDGGRGVVDTGFGARCELEGLAHDAMRGRLLLACKETRGGWAHGDGLTLLTWSLGTAASGPPIRVPRARVHEAGFGALHASDVAIDPITLHIVVVAAREHALAELTAEGDLVAVRSLGPGHPQAEGLTFLRDGTLVIADEGQPAPGWLTVYPLR